MAIYLNLPCQYQSSDYHSNEGSRLMQVREVAVNDTHTHPMDYRGPVSRGSTERGVDLLRVDAHLVRRSKVSVHGKRDEQDELMAEKVFAAKRHHSVS